MNHGHVAAAKLQPASGFESQQPSADDGCFQTWTRFCEQCARIVERSKHVYVALIKAGDLRHKGAAAGCEDQAIVFGLGSALVDDNLPLAVNFGYATPESGANVVRFVPVDVVQDDLVGRFLAGEHAR